MLSSKNGKVTLAKGVIQLGEEKDKTVVEGVPLYREAIFCRSGEWEGMYGPVDVTKEMLQLIADKYNSERANALNENDYAPIQVDHDRSVENTMGRVDISRVKLSVVEVEDPNTEGKGWALFGELRVDDEQAKKNVLSGKYAQLSITFDDKNFTFYEISFVAVEAARRSIVLQQGENTVGDKNFESKFTQLSASMATGRATRLGLRVALMGTLTHSKTELKALQETVFNTVNSLKLASLTAEFKSIVKAGKMPKAEFDKLDIKSFSLMNKESLKVILSSYHARPVSSDFVQVGTAGQNPVDDESLKTLSTKSAMAKAMEAQKNGTALSADPAPAATEEEVAKAAKEAELAGEDEGDKDPSLSEVEEVLKQFAGITEQIKKLEDNNKAIEEALSKLEAADKEEGE